jgi:8-oxo-dGTP diphosphatase
MAWPVTPQVTSDCVVFNRTGAVLLIRRKNPPFQGQYALPGGFIEVGETVEDGCRRELREETGIVAGKLHLVGIYSDPGRDPRGHTVSIVYFTRVSSANAVAKDDAAAVEWVKRWRTLSLAFDHAKILADAVRKARTRRN